jgi:hypothetical protein
MKNAFVELHRAALTCATDMMSRLDTDQQAFVERACAGGGRLTVELGPMPDCRRVAVNLVEREGRRVELCFATVEIIE